MVCTCCGKAFDGDKTEWDLAEDEFKSDYNTYEVDWIVTCPHCGSVLLVTDTYRMVNRKVVKSFDIGHEVV